MGKKGFDAKKHWEIYFNALRKQEWAKALSALEAIKEAEPGPNVLLKIGDTLQRTGKTAEAISAYHNAAWLLMKAGFAQKALAIYKVILRLDPNNEEAINKSKEIMFELESARPGAAIEATGKPEEAPSGPAHEEAVFEPTSLAEQARLSPPQWAHEEAQATEKETAALWDTAGPEKAQSAMAQSAIFSALPEETVTTILGRAEEKTYGDGRCVVEEGDTGDSIFVIKEGRAKVSAHIMGKTIELATLQEGDAFGEVAFLTGRPRTASVSASGELRVVELNRLLIEDIIEQHPEVMEKLQDFFQTRVKATIKKVKGEARPPS